MVSIGDVVRAVVSEHREELDRLNAYIQGGYWVAAIDFGCLVYDVSKHQNASALVHMMMAWYAHSLINMVVLPVASSTITDGCNNRRLLCFAKLHLNLHYHWWRWQISLELAIYQKWSREFLFKTSLSNLFRFNLKILYPDGSIHL